MKLEEIKKLILDGNYDDALNKIEELENQFPAETFHPRYKVAKSECFLRLNMYKKALKITQEVLNECGKTEEIDDYSINEIKIDTINIMVESLWLLGQFDEGIKFIKNGEEILQNLKEKQTKNVSSQEAILMLHKGLIYLNKGELDQALESLNISLILNEKLGNKEIIAKALNGIGSIHIRKGELNQALESFQKSLKTSKEIGSKERMASSFGNIGVTYKMKGELDNALENHQKSLRFNEEIGNKRAIAIALNNIGLIYKEKGELDRALEYLHQSLEISEELENKHFIAHTDSNLGSVYQQKDDFEQAYSYYTQSLELFNELGNLVDMSETLFYLVSLTIELNSLDQAKDYLQQLKHIYEQEENMIISHRYNIGLALFLKKSTNVKDKVEAESLLTQIINDDVVDHKLTIIALLNKFELLISEISHYGDKEALTEAQLIFNDLIKIAKEQNNYCLLTETYWLKAQLSLAQLDINNARFLLCRAQIIAEGKGLTKLAKKISKEHDKLLDQIKIMNEIEKKDISLAERVKEQNFVTFISNMWKQKELEELEKQEEEPIFLLLLSETGIPFYSKNFAVATEVDDILVSGYISAINKFIQEAFGVSGCIDRIKYKERNIIIKKIGSLYSCYIYKGESYEASQKMESFRTNIKNSLTWKHLQKNDDIIKRLGQSETGEIEAIVDKIF